MSWSEYEKRAIAEYQQLLASDPTESQLQDFFERNPSYLPGARTPPPPSGHAPFPGAVISQPELKGIGEKRPDFMWIAHHTGIWYPTLIEIETPRKKVFQRSAKNRTKLLAEFTEARNQLDEWKTWFKDTANLQLFERLYQIPSDYIRSDQMRLHLILLYGLRKEYVDHAEKNKHLVSLFQSSDSIHETFMSFDSGRLRPDRDLWYALTVKLRACGRYQAIAVQPTFQLGPGFAEWLLLIDGIEDAVNADPRFTPDRKKFICDRLPYWREYAQASGTKVISPNSWE